MNNGFKRKKGKLLLNYKNIHYYDIIGYILVLGICFLIFQHGDLFHTVSSSYAYLYGHFSDFYDYNKPLVGRNDYLPIIYVIFAIWEFPLRLFGLLHDVASSGITLGKVEFIWSKLLLVLFYFGTLVVIGKMSPLLTKKEKQARLIPVLFATSPIALFAVFIFGQYDIIGLFFTMVGFYYYIKNNYIKFSIFFSIAISLKFFPLIIFLPLILLVEKRVLYLAKYILIALAATLLQFLIYYKSEVFRHEIFAITKDQAGALKNFSISPFMGIPYLFIIVIIICLYAYIRDPEDNDEKNKLAVFLSISSYACMFSTIVWHPQWLIIIMPFFALSFVYVNNGKRVLLIDLLGMVSFVYIVANIFPQNVDVNMAYAGMFRSVFPHNPLFLKDFFKPKLMPLVMSFFTVYLFSPLLIQIFQRIGQKNDEALKNENMYIRSRFYLGMAVFIIPVFVCILMPVSLAQKINPTAGTVQGLMITQAEETAGPINGGTSVKQTFIAEKNKLSIIGVEFATYERINKCKVTLELIDSSNNKIASKIIDGEAIKDNDFIDFYFPPINNSNGRKYTVKISSDGTSDNSITVWKTKASVYQSVDLFANDMMISGNMCMKVYYLY